MLITTMYSQVVRFTWASEYSQDDFLEDVNMVKDEFWSKIVARLEEDRHYQEWRTTPVALQSEYKLEEVASNNEWTKMLKSVSLNYDWETYTDTWALKYTPAREVNKDTLWKEWNYYVENQDKSDPIYFIADNSFFIAPAFRTEEAWDYRMKLTWIRNITDYTIDTTEADMIIPSDYQRVLLMWVIPYALMSKRADNNDVQKAQNDYEAKLATAIMNLASRKEWPITMEYPVENESDIIILNRK